VGPNSGQSGHLYRVETASGRKRTCDVQLCPFNFRILERVPVLADKFAIMLFVGQCRTW
jgi:hypothetical protein